MGHEDRTTSTISFNASTRTFTIAPVSTSFTVWCKGKKVVVSSAQTVTIPNTSGMYSIYFDANGALAAKAGYFTFSEEAPTAYIYWNAATGACPYFGDERHGVVLDWQTHEYLHRTRGAALASGFGASGYTLGGNGSSNAHAQLTLEGGTFFDEDMKIIVTATNTPTAGTWEQDLLSPARIPVLYLSGTGWVIDAPTDYPLKQGTARPQYNALSGGVWSTADVANNKYATSWILATNNLTYPVIAIIGQAESDLQSAAEAVDFTSLQLPGFPSVEFRPLYRLVFQCADSFSNAVKASLVSITDIRSIAAAGVAASLITDHGNLSGLSDDDHPQYLSVDTVRTSLTAAVKASFLPSQTGNAGKFLTTDATSTSWASLTSGNITTALGFTPYNVTNPAGYITGITSSDVTTALGFTPYNATNPSGFVTAAGARGAISVTGAGSYDSATGVINIVGGVTSFNTRTGAITLSSADVTTALGFTPYNSTNPNGYLTGITSTQVTTALGYTPYNSSNPSGYITGITSGMVTTALGFTPYNNSNPSGYITSSALSGYLTSASAASTYLPLAGGTITGQLNVNNSGSATAVMRLWSAGSTIWSLGVGDSSGTNFNISADFGSLLINKSSGNVTTPGQFYAGTSNLVLHAGNYNSYALPLGGGTVTVATYFTNIADVAGDFYIRGRIYSLNAASNGWNVVFERNGGSPYITNVTYAGNTILHAGNYNSYALPLTGGTVTGQITSSANGNQLRFVRADGTTPNWTFHGWGSGLNIYSSAVSTLYIGRDGPGTSLDVYNGSLTQGGNQVLHAGNYNSYSPTLTGGNASGTWGINVTGTASSISGYFNPTIDPTPSTIAYRTVNGDIAAREIILSSGLSSSVPTVLVSMFPTTNQMVRTTPAAVASAIQSAASGSWGINITGSAGSLSDTSNYMVGRGSYSAGSVDSITGLGVWNQNNVGDSQTVLVFGQGGSTSTVQQKFHYGGSMEFRNRTDSVSWTAWKTVLTSANYTSYSPALTGGGASGTWGINVTGYAATLKPTNVTNTAASVWNPGGLTYQAWGQSFSHSSISGDSGDLTLWLRPSQYSGGGTELNMYIDGDFFSGSGAARVLNASNYSSYALPLSGGTLSGAVTGTTFQGGGWGVHLNPSTAAIRGNGGYGGALALVDGSYGIAFWSQVGTLHFGFGSNTAVTAKATMDASGNFNTAGAITQASNQVLHAGNYSSYALPLGGGTVTGTTTFSQGLRIGPTPGDPNAYIITRTMPSGDPNAANEATELLLFHSNDPANGAGPDYITLRAPAIRFQTYDNAAVADPDASGGWNNRLTISPAGVVNVPGTLQQGGNQVLHASNYSSYALPLSGGTLSGTLSFNQPVGLGFANGQYIKDNGSGGLVIYSGAAVNINGSSITINSNTAWHSGNASRAGNSDLMYYAGFTLNANDMPANSTGFTYAVNAPAVGPVARFSTGGGYDLWLNAPYSGGGNNLYFRTRNGDAASLNGWKAIIHDGNYSDYVNPKGGSWYGSGLPGSRWGGYAVGGGELSFGNGLPNAGQLGILIDGCYVAAENNGFWSLASDNTWGSRRGMYWDGSYLNFTTNTPSARFQSILADGDLTVSGTLRAYSNAIRTRRIDWVNASDSQTSDPYVLRWRSETDGDTGSQSWLELQMNDDAEEEFRIYGHSCSGYGCGQISGNLLHRFYSNGNAWHSGNVTAYSDARVKENVVAINNAVDKVMQIRGVTFTRTDRADTEKRHAGVIAQEVEAVLPEVVDTDEFGMKSVAYGNMVGLLIEAIKEQQAQIVELKRTIDEIRG